ncbi:amidase [Rhodococcus sp. NBC_00297]|uniref:amidase n=1 Tax=Rhodococcus sp. NBC_00297 TaxID=2976005 RepID=UPI002E2A26F5|nr:amidase [Rhodococcus sp. NBC_00297]
MTEDLTWLPAWRIAALVAAREVSPIEVTQHFLDRIEKLDSTLHAFAHLDAAGALEQAKRAEDDVANGETLGTLHGVPFAVMEMTRVKGMPSIPWGSESCSADDLVVERLRAAGAIVVGTTNSYYFKPEDRPRNPWNLDRDTGNSSRGSAAAVSGGLLPFTLAQDGAGSTRLPAAWNGLLGLHPSRGLIPHINYEKPGLLFGVSVGPITRDARDAAVITQAIAGPDGRDFLSIQDEPRDYLAALDKGVSGLRIAWTDDFGWSSIYHREESVAVVAASRRSAFEFRSLGAAVNTTTEVWGNSLGAFFALQGAMKRMSPDLPVDLKEVQGRNAAYDVALGLEPEEQTAVVDVPEATAADYEAAALERKRLWSTTMRVFDSNDIIASPTTLLLPKTFEEWGLQGRDLIFTSYAAHTALFNLLGFPALTVPCGFIDGLPVGMQLVARPGREDLLFRAAKSFLDAFPRPERPAVAC